MSRLVISSCMSMPQTINPVFYCSTTCEPLDSDLSGDSTESRQWRFPTKGCIHLQASNLKNTQLTLTSHFSGTSMTTLERVCEGSIHWSPQWLYCCWGSCSAQPSKADYKKSGYSQSSKSWHTLTFGLKCSQSKTLSPVVSRRARPCFSNSPSLTWDKTNDIIKVVRLNMAHLTEVLTDSNK